MQLPNVVDCHAHLENHLLSDQGFGFHQILARCERYAVEAVVYSLFYDLSTAQIEFPLDRIEDVAAKHSSVHVGLSFGICPPTVAIPTSILHDQLVGAETAARRLADTRRIVAIGEVGLDYYWPVVEYLKGQGVRDWGQISVEMRDRGDQLLVEPQVQNCLETQAVIFQATIRLAVETGLPLVIHGRDAYADILEVLASTDIDPERVMLHCFAGTVEEAVEAASRNYRISIPSSVGYRKKFAEVAKQIDLANLVVETDSPYHSPFTGHWKASKEIARRLTPPADLTRDDRKQQIAENRLESFFGEVDNRYPNLAFTVLQDGQTQTLSARQYLTAEAHRQYNESTFVRCAATEIAKLRTVDVRDVCSATTANARKLFSTLF